MIFDEVICNGTLPKVHQREKLKSEISYTMLNSLQIARSVKSLT